MYEHKQLFDSMLDRIREVGAENGRRLPQAFGQWFAEMYFEEPRGIMYADGPGDAKVDLFFTTSNGKEVRHHVLNTKFTETYNATAPVSFYNEITAFWQAFKNKSNRGNYLETMVRKELRRDYAKLFDYYDDGRANLYFLTNSKRNDTQVQAVKDYDVDIFHLDDVLQFMADFVENAMPRTPPLRLTGINNVLSADKEETEVPTSIVFARLTDFISYMKEDQFDLLFNRNVRVWLGNTEVNKSIRETFKTHPKEFAYSNNGITILCESHTTHQGQHEIVVNNPRVVNGSQTLHSIRDVAINAASRAARVLVRIIEIPPLASGYLPEQAERRKEIIRKIAIRNNSQNNIKKWDLVSNDEFQLELARYFRTKRLFYERRRKEWSQRRTKLKSVGIRRGPEIKRLAQLIASFYWDDKLLGPVAAKKPEELFEGHKYDKITKTPPEVAYQLFLLDDVIESHVDELSRTKRYVSNLARHMKHALLGLVVRALQSANAKWGSEEFTECLEEETEFHTGKWRLLVLGAINHIRGAYRTEDSRYRQREKQPLAIVNFFKSQGYMTRVFPTAMPKSLKATARRVL